MTYSATYSTGDFKSIVIDILGSGAVEVVNFIGLLVVLTMLTLILVRLQKVGVKL
jgi:hypothetical protein